ncbi:MAG: MerR family transcriptional regulator [Candidatus Aminicenantales bacterium]
MSRTYRVKEFADLTNVTVRTLHHYDRIGLLRARRRARNGYRVYAERDLLRLQQIVTLKFMGFRLEEIRRILARPRFAVSRALTVQVEAVEREIQRLTRAARALRETAADLNQKGRIDWTKLIHIMEDLQMSEQKKQEWTKKFFSETDRKEFADIGKNYNAEAMKAYQDRWTALIEEVKANLQADPAGPVAQDLARRWTELLNEAYGGHPELKQKIGHAYQEAWKTGDDFGGHMPFGPEIWDFIKKAQKAAGTSCAAPSK